MSSFSYCHQLLLFIAAITVDGGTIIYIRNEEYSPQPLALEVEVDTTIDDVKREIRQMFHLNDPALQIAFADQFNDDQALLADLGIGSQFLLHFQVVNAVDDSPKYLLDLSIIMAKNARNEPSSYWNTRSAAKYSFACNVSIDTDTFFDELRFKVLTFMMRKEPRHVTRATPVIISIVPADYARCHCTKSRFIQQSKHKYTRLCKSSQMSESWIRLRSWSGCRYPVVTKGDDQPEVRRNPTGSDVIAFKPHAFIDFVSTKSRQEVLFYQDDDINSTVHVLETGILARFALPCTMQSARDGYTVEFLADDYKAPQAASAAESTQSSSQSTDSDSSSEMEERQHTPHNKRKRCCVM